MSVASKPLVHTQSSLTLVLRLAIPVLIEQFLSMLVMLSDTALAGRYLEPAHMAAMSLLAYVMWLIPCLYGAISIGATAMVARFVGGGDYESARRVANQAVLLGALVTLAVVLGLHQFGPHLVRMMNLSEESAGYALRYLDLLLWVMPAVMLCQIGPACLRGAGDTVTGMVVMGLVNALNVVLSWALVLGWWGLPQLGWDGLAWGTAIGYAVGGIAMLAVLLHGRAGLAIRAQALAFHPNLVRRMLRIGIPGGSDMLAIVLCHMWFVSIIFQLGDVAAAAHGVAVRIEALAYLPGTAFQVAATTLTGQFLGARNEARATQSTAVAGVLGATVMSAAGLVLFFGAEPLVRLFVRGDAEEVIAQAAPLLRIVSVSMPVLAVSMVFSGALRGAGDTRWPFVFTLISMLGVRIPGAYLLTQPSWGLGVAGAWYAMIGEIFTRGVLVTVRFVQGAWKKIEV